MKIPEPARVSMRNASLKVGAIGLGRCLRGSMALLRTVVSFSPPRLHAQAGRYTCRRFILAPAAGNSILRFRFNWPASVTEVAPHFIAYGAAYFLRKCGQRLTG